MATFTSILDHAKQNSKFSEKNSLLRGILNHLQSKKGKIKSEDKQELAAFAFEEIKGLIALIPTLQSYREKDEVFGYEDSLLGIVMLCHASPAEIGEDNLKAIQALVELVEKERFVENAVDNIFRNGQTDKATVGQLIAAVSPLKDEYHKGQLYQGLLHYQGNIDRLPLDSKLLLADYIASELKRYLDTSLDDEILFQLEVACDVAKYFVDDRIIALLNEILTLQKNNVSFYALSALLKAGQPIPSDVVVALANDLVYADGTYALLKQHNQTALFPPELANPEYLAKSDLVHWLTYPTELGSQPDAIEYLGKVKKKGDYYIFRYTSDSDNLGDDLKGQWLIGWANDDGGTFSNFDLYAAYEKKTLEKTLKNIKKHLL